MHSASRVGSCHLQAEVIKEKVSSEEAGAATDFKDVSKTLQLPRWL